MIIQRNKQEGRKINCLYNTRFKPSIFQYPRYFFFAHVILVLLLHVIKPSLENKTSIKKKKYDVTNRTNIVVKTYTIVERKIQYTTRCNQRNMRFYYIKWNVTSKKGFCYRSFSSTTLSMSSIFFIVPNYLFDIFCILWEIKVLCLIFF